MTILQNIADRWNTNIRIVELEDNGNLDLETMNYIVILNPQNCVNILNEKVYSRFQNFLGECYYKVSSNNEIMVSGIVRPYFAEDYSKMNGCSMSLNSFIFIDSIVSAVRQPVILHEFGHCLGLRDLKGDDYWNFAMNQIPRAPFPAEIEHQTIQNAYKNQVFDLKYMFSVNWQKTYYLLY